MSLSFHRKVFKYDVVVFSLDHIYYSYTNVVQFIIDMIYRYKTE